MSSVFTTWVPAVQVWWGDWWTSTDDDTWHGGYGDDNTQDD